MTNEKEDLLGLPYLLVVSHGAVGVPNVAKCPTHAGPVTQLPADVQVRLEGVNLNFYLVYGLFKFRNSFRAKSYKSIVKLILI